MKIDDHQADAINSHLRGLQEEALEAASQEQADGFVDRINSLLRELSTDALIDAMIEKALEGEDGPVVAAPAMPAFVLEDIPVDPAWEKLPEFA